MKMKSLMAVMLFAVISAVTAGKADADVLDISDEPVLNAPEEMPSHFTYDSGVEIPYPEEGVRGIFVSGYIAGSEQPMNELVDYVSTSGLNSMVIDVKEDMGDIMMELPLENEVAVDNMHSYVDPETLMAQMEENQIYPIARIVVFKDSRLAAEAPELSFQNADGSVWANGRGENFVNPFLKEVWDYNVDIAVEAAKLGFKEIQFDYVRFPEGFEFYGDSLDYDLGEYDDDREAGERRVDAVTDFVEYAYDELQPYGVDVSVDIFGYSATHGAAEGIGQDFSRISEEVDVISSMIYPSHWGPGLFGIDAPDTEPYEVINQYAQEENAVLAELDDPPISRPWLQDFTASYLGAGNYLEYGADEVEAQIQALKDNGIDEFLLWDASNQYSRGANYDLE
ncbi:hypothetical protein ABHD89_000993 [Salinicoccus halitifaciens]|uniref:DUF4015 domain-containing protein n=2 Tax=Salinicoccus halitifaciens TaxID=1073415 RepID=A0ABV2E850_9STAP